MTARLDLPPGPVLVIAPHPDDETLGCGGLIAATVRRGDPVHTVFVTEGGASHPACRSWTRPRRAARRRAEAVEALRRLGAGNEPRTFLRLPDAAMPVPGEPAHAEAYATLVRIVDLLQPALAVLPWRRDPHCDHRASWALATGAIAASGQSPAILEYAIWLDELGAPGDHPAPGEAKAVALAVPEAVKRHALLAHRSQLGAGPFDDPNGFALAPATIERLTGPQETYWRPCAAR